MTLRPRHASGFTLVELNLAIVFVALLLLAIATTVMNVTHTYQYGVSLKTINQLGREVADQIRRDAMSSSPEQIEYTLPSGTSEGIGRLCLGSVSYVFNNASLLNNPDVTVTKIKDIGVATPKPITLLRIEDSSKSWCDTSKNTIDSATADFTELLLNDNTPVAIHSMSVSTLTEASVGLSSESIMRITFDLGTNETETTNGGQCKPPTATGENFDNCAVRQFVVTVRTVGTGG